MKELFLEFPYLADDMIIIKKMEERDSKDLFEISHNDNVYKYIPPFLYKKSLKTLETAIRNLGERDFEKKKLIIAGIYLKDNPNKLIGLAEMFDYKKRDSNITIGYRLNENYWNKKIATRTVKLLIQYLINEIGLNSLSAFVMKENIYSIKVLLNNGFIKEDFTSKGTNWGNQESVDLNVFTFKK